jgi:hypothetical protein
VARPPRFAGAPAVIEVTRSYEMPDVASLPGGADVRVEFYGGAYFFWLDGERHRIHVELYSLPLGVGEREVGRLVSDLQLCLRCCRLLRACLRAARRVCGVGARASARGLPGLLTSLTGHGQRDDR